MQVFRVMWIAFAVLLVLFSWTKKPAYFPTETDPAAVEKNVTLVKVFRHIAGGSKYDRASFLIEGEEDRCGVVHGCGLRCQLCSFVTGRSGEAMQAWLVGDAVVMLKTKDGKVFKQSEIGAYVKHRWWTFSLPIMLLAILSIVAIETIKKKFPVTV